MKDLFARIREAAKLGKGLKLSAEDVRLLSLDAAIENDGAPDPDWKRKAEGR